jgi:hypothetical protein
MATDKYVVPITMLGPTGVGKTSLLAAMYRVFAHTTGATKLELTPQGATTSSLREAIAELERLSRQVVVRSGVEATGITDIKDYEFGVGLKNKAPRFTLRFTDYGGEKLTEDGGALKQTIYDRLAASPVIILAVDAPALMYDGGRYHNEVNLPEDMYEVVKQIMQRDDRHRLLLLVPLKCERYMETTQGAQELAGQVQEGYKSLLAHVSHRDVRHRVATVVIPVQTTGTIWFSSATDGPGGPAFQFRSKVLNAPFNPVDAEQPLRYSLRFAINVYRHERRGAFRTFAERVMRTDPALVAALEEFSSAPPSSPGIRILQHHAHLSDDARGRG